MRKRRARTGNDREARNEGGVRMTIEVAWWVMVGLVFLVSGIWHYRRLFRGRQRFFKGLAMGHLRKRNWRVIGVCKVVEGLSLRDFMGSLLGIQHMTKGVRLSPYQLEERIVVARDQKGGIQVGRLQVKIDVFENVKDSTWTDEDEL